jgi:Gas vesicle synthesis protein GvpO
MQPRELLETAREQAAALIGKPIESVSALDRDSDEAWVIHLEVLELERVPNTMDVLASYEIKLSDDGELLGFHRRRRYHRAAEDDGRE